FAMSASLNPSQPAMALRMRARVVAASSFLSFSCFPISFDFTVPPHAVRRDSAAPSHEDFLEVLLEGFTEELDEELVGNPCRASRQILPGVMSSIAARRAPFAGCDARIAGCS